MNADLPTVCRGPCMSHGSAFYGCFHSVSIIGTIKLFKSLIDLPNFLISKSWFPLTRSMVVELDTPKPQLLLLTGTGVTRLNPRVTWRPHSSACFPLKTANTERLETHLLFLFSDLRKWKGHRPKQ